MTESRLSLAVDRHGVSRRTRRLVEAWRSLSELPVKTETELRWMEMLSKELTR